MDTKRIEIVPLQLWEALQRMTSNAKFTTQIIAADGAKTPREAIDSFGKKTVPNGKLICLNIDQPAQKEEFSFAQVQAILGLCQTDPSADTVWGATINPATEYYRLELVVEI